MYVYMYIQSPIDIYVYTKNDCTYMHSYIASQLDFIVVNPAVAAATSISN